MRVTTILALSGVKFGHVNDFLIPLLVLQEERGDRSLNDQGGLCICMSKY